MAGPGAGPWAQGVVDWTSHEPLEVGAGTLGRHWTPEPLGRERGTVSDGAKEGELMDPESDDAVPRKVYSFSLLTSR